MSNNICNYIVQLYKITQIYINRNNKYKYLIIIIALPPRNAPFSLKRKRGQSVYTLSVVPSIRL